MRLLASYMEQPYVFFLGRNSAELVKTLFTDTARITQYALVPCLQIVSKGMSALCITALLFAIEPTLAALVVAVLGTGYLLAYILVRGVIAREGRTSLRSAAERATRAHEALGGIKEIKLLGQELYFLKRVQESSLAWSGAQAALQILSGIPRYAIELLSFGAVLVLTVYVLWTSPEPSRYLPMLALYAFAGLRLMPALQQIFTATANLRFSVPAVKAVLSDLAVHAQEQVASDPLEAIPFERAIQVRSLFFRYPGAQGFQLRNINLMIRKNSAVAFVGSTGCGKTTLVDILMGLLSPVEGEVLVDDFKIDQATAGRWRCRIGHVPQQIFLCDGSIASNIAFGVEDDGVDCERLHTAARAANLHLFVQTALAARYDTPIGERGVRLSGGQRQRIGIARALYREPEVLVLDEATSALDAETEAAVMDAIDNLAGKKTLILIAHRVTTVRRCDVIYLMENGEIVDSGSYEELLERSQRFRQFAGVGWAHAQTNEPR
jgi:ABC-type multidrug transport system fused ATPase/permease subunit